MVVHYGMLKGIVDLGLRSNEIERRTGEENNHFHLFVSSEDTLWRCPINVKSFDDSMVWYVHVNLIEKHPNQKIQQERDKILALLNQPLEDQLYSPDPLKEKTLDFIRKPLFDRRDMRQLPKDLPGPRNDLQDEIEDMVKRAIGHPVTRVYVFGSYWRDQAFGANDELLNTNHGMHDIHMNQGNYKSHIRDNGILQDGGVILKYDDDRVEGIFMCFDTQFWQTDDRGFKEPGRFSAGPLAELPGAEVPTVGPEFAIGSGASESDLIKIRIVEAVPNPYGPDAGRETVTLRNVTSRELDLNNWSILDRAGNEESLTGKIKSYQEQAICLRGDVKLGNNGGVIKLRNPDGIIVEMVTYGKAKENQKFKWS